jgi:membrane associated rhomboid family serine protease
MRLAFPPLTPAVRAILLLLAVSFVVQTIAEPFLGLPLFSWLGLQNELGIASLWQWATYPLVELPTDQRVVHRALDLLFIYFLLTPFEHRFGREQTVVLTGLAIPAGAALPLLTSVLLPSVSLPVAGAGAVVWAGLGAFAVMTAGRPLNWVFLPAMNAWTLTAIMLVITGLQCAWMGTPTPLLSALGALGAGILYTRRLERPKVRRAPPAKRRDSHLQVILGGQSDDERPRWLH